MDQVCQCRRWLTDLMFWFSPERDVVRVHGPDALTYLHSQLSQAVGELAVGGSTWSFVLQPTGKVEVLLRVWRTADDEVVLDTDGGYGAALVARLQRFKIRVKAEIVSLDWLCVAVRGGAGDAAADGGLVAWGGGTDLLGAEVGAP